MSFEFRDAKRQDIRLLILLAGGTGSGKTESAMRLATGLAGGQPFAVIDTENGRALHKADDYTFKHAPLDEPFSPERYAEAVKAADDFPVIVIDSGSHEWEGAGGVLDMQTEEFERLGGRDSARMASWIQPKQRHKRFVQTLLRSRAHVILCLRAEDKIEIIDDPDRPGKKKVVEKKSLTGVQGWIPIVEKRLPFEATISLLLLQSNPGVPVPIKLERRHADLIPLDKQLDESVGAALAKWAAGGQPKTPGASSPPQTPEAAPQAADDLDPTKRQIDKLEVMVAWLRRTEQITTRQLWIKVANHRSTEAVPITADELIALYGGIGEDGELHWSPLREVLRRGEASMLIDALVNTYGEAPRKTGAAA